MDWKILIVTNRVLTALQFQSTFTIFYYNNGLKGILQHNEVTKNLSLYDNFMHNAYFVYMTITDICLSVCKGRVAIVK